MSKPKPQVLGWNSELLPFFGDTWVGWGVILTPEPKVDLLLFFLSLKYVCECGVLHVILHIGWCSMHKCKTGKVWIIFQASKMYVVFGTDFSLCSRSNRYNLTLCIVYPQMHWYTLVQKKDLELCGVERTNGEPYLMVAISFEVFQMCTDMSIIMGLCRSYTISMKR